MCTVAINISCTTLTICRNIPTVSLSSSIEWDDCEDILVTGTGVVRSEGVVCLSDISTVSTGDGCWVVCHIVDEDRVYTRYQDQHQSHPERREHSMR